MLAALALLVPDRCLACRARAPLPWCDGCAERVRTLAVGCPRCAGPPTAGHACWVAGAPVASTVAVWDYGGVVASAVVTAKVGGAHRAWPALAEPLAERLRRAPPDADVVTWVTTGAARVRERGVDHAALLARAVGAALALPVRRLLDVRTGRDGVDRYRARMRLPATDVLLVDDVVTTGATAHAAASALVAAGAGRVALAVLARAGRHPLGAAPPPTAPSDRPGGRPGPSRTIRGERSGALPGAPRAAPPAPPDPSAPATPHPPPRAPSAPPAT